MATRTKIHLGVPFDPGHTVRVRFTQVPSEFEVRQVHFVKVDGHYRHEDCGGNTCTRCLSGEHLSQRYTTEVLLVEENDKPRIFEMPLGAFKMLLAAHLDAGDLLGYDWRIGRSPVPQRGYWIRRA